MISTLLNITTEEYACGGFHNGKQCGLSMCVTFNLVGELINHEHNDNI